MICWWCGNALVQAVTRKPLEGEPLMVYEREVRVHKTCVKDAYDFIQQNNLTADVPRPKGARSE